jgi:hypothetical protein
LLLVLFGLVVAALSVFAGAGVLLCVGRQSQSYLELLQFKDTCKFVSPDDDQLDGRNM